MNTALSLLLDLAVASVCVSVIAAPFVALFVMWRKGLLSRNP